MSPRTNGLAAHQRQVRDLIKGRARHTELTDPYFNEVATSTGLALVREIIHWWRALGLERSCALTAAALKQQGIFESTVALFIREHRISPYVDELSRDFLDVTSGHDNDVISSVAQFERALLQVKRGDANSFVIAWRHDPVTVLNGLLNEMPIDEQPSEGLYETLVSRDVEGLFRVLPIESR